MCSRVRFPIPPRPAALTHFTKHPGRFLTRSTNDPLCFSFDGEIYTLQPGAEPRKVPVSIAEDGRETIDRIVRVNEGFTEAKLSPNGKEFAYVFRGEIFVSSVEGGITKRITNTPWQERSVDFSHDGRSLVYRRREGQQLERVHGHHRAQGGAVLLRVDRAEAGDGRRHPRGGVSSRRFRRTAKRWRTWKTA